MCQRGRIGVITQIRSVITLVIYISVRNEFQHRLDNPSAELTRRSIHGSSNSLVVSSLSYYCLMTIRSVALRNGNAPLFVSENVVDQKKNERWGFPSRPPLSSCHLAMALGGLTHTRILECRGVWRIGKSTHGN